MRSLALRTLLTLTLCGAPSIGVASFSTSLSTDLDSLLAQGSTLLATAQRTTLTSLTMATTLTTLASQVDSYRNAIQGVWNTVAAAAGTTTFSVTDAILVDLQALSAIDASLAQEIARLSAAAQLLAASTGLTTLQSAMATTLRLSDDIGTMADRILEMAGLIMVMADNIGTMADRILATMVIQNTNIALVNDSTLVTQQNVITVISLFLG